MHAAFRPRLDLTVKLRYFSGASDWDGRGWLLGTNDKSSLIK
jgi:hypothetical protein